MRLKTMHKPQKDSPSTYLTATLTQSATSVTVASAAILPQETPYPLTIGFDKNRTEVVMVTSVDNLSNRLTITRGSDAKEWPDQTKVARVFNADDLLAVQENISELGKEITNTRGTTDVLLTSMTTLSSKVGNEKKGLIKDLSDEIARAKEAEKQESDRAKQEENRLDASKANKSDLTQVVTGIEYNQTASGVRTIVHRKNAQSGQESTDEKDIPIASDSLSGLMPREAVLKLREVATEMAKLSAKGGRFAGRVFQRKSDLDSFRDSSLRDGDFTLVVSDESQGGSMTLYMYSNRSFSHMATFGSQAQIATSSVPGIVKGSSATGRISVDRDGEMILNGWGSLNNGKVDKTTTINGKPLSGNVRLTPEDIGVSGSTKVSIPANSWSGRTSTVTVPSSVISGAKAVIVGQPEDLTERQREAMRLALMSPTSVSGNTITLTADGVVPTIELKISILAVK